MCGQLQNDMKMYGWLQNDMKIVGDYKMAWKCVGDYKMTWNVWAITKWHENCGWFQNGMKMCGWWEVSLCCRCPGWKLFVAETTDMTTMLMSPWWWVLGGLTLTPEWKQHTSLTITVVTAGHSRYVGKTKRCMLSVSVANIAHLFSFMCIPYLMKHAGGCCFFSSWGTIHLRPALGKAHMCFTLSFRCFPVLPFK